MWGEGGVEQRPKGICGAVFGRWGTGTRQAKRTGVYHTALEEFPLATQVSQATCNYVRKAKVSMCSGQGLGRARRCDSLS